MQDGRDMEVLVDMTNHEVKGRSTSKLEVRYQDNERILNGAAINGAKVDGSHSFAPPSLAQANLQAMKPNGVEYPQEMYVRNEERDHSHRRASSPMMPAFMVSAPGKVIVFGEHAVVHGKAAMAAAISLRSYLLVTSLSKSRRTVSLRFPDISLDHTWNIDSLPWASFASPSKKKFYYDLVTSLDPELVEAMKPHVAQVSLHMPEDVRKIHQSAASAFLYLFLSLSSQSSSACVYTLRSTIPIGAGLGSSASICVCLSAALLLQIRILAGPHRDQPKTEAELQLERINRWAFVGEMCIHGNPSGVDNTVSSGGKAVLFKRKDYQKPPIVTPLRNFPELPLMLVNTRQSRSTAVEVAKVGALKKAHPLVTELMLDSIDQVTESAHQLISSSSSSSASTHYDDAFLQHLGELIRINHGLLVSLGVSHPRLERIRELVDHAGIGWTKLTGAGGGGCAITMLRPDVNADIFGQVQSKLDSEGFEIYETTLGGDGVGVLWPAVLKNGTNEEGGEEIDQDKFLNAIGIDGVERLVGVGVEERREGWQFWRT
ncbi:MAG: Mevalonate kinase [Peltula sp. TS41687]|nr:MAG: Mevalonate kinase [Peltula sp. TS41687]